MDMNTGRRHFLKTCLIGAFSLPELLESAAESSVPGTFSRTYDHGDVYEFNPGRVLVTGVVSRRGAPAGYFVDMIEDAFGDDYNPLLAVTGGFSTMQGGRVYSVGKIVVNQSDLTPGIHEKDGWASFVFHRPEEGNTTAYISSERGTGYTYRRGGLVHLLPETRITGRGIDPGNSCDRIAVGIKPDGNIIVHAGEMRAKDAAGRMNDYGCGQAALGDGDSFCFYHSWTGGGSRHPHATLKDAMVFLQHK